MKGTERGFVVQVLIALIAVFVTSGVYLFMYSQNREERVETKLAEAREKASSETKILNNLKKEFDAAYPLYATLRDGYIETSRILGNTDEFFDMSDPLHPTIKLKTRTSAIASDINAKRSLIEKMLQEWKEKAAKTLAAQADAATLQSIQESAGVIESFIADLIAIVENLTPSNSGLQQSQIDNYAEILSETQGQITDIIDALENAKTEGVVSEVTALQIDIQEQALLEAQAEVTALEQELEDIQTANRESAVEVQNTSTETPDTTSEEDAVDYTQEDTSSESIIVVPGIPRLIQGANKN